ncbi:MAG: ATP-binding protein, partial [Actinomycetota bacterium]|nr:ATP-binding protein [Actinomycetota bacterium]
DSVLATAILDRHLHHCVVVNAKGDSYRLKDRRNQGTDAHLEVALTRCQGPSQPTRWRTG